MKLTKSIKKQLFNMAAMSMDSFYALSDGNYSIWDIVSSDSRPEEVIPQAEEWLDDNCSNGYFSRWTSFGGNLHIDAVKLEKRLYEIYDRFF